MFTLNKRLIKQRPHTKATADGNGVNDVTEERILIRPVLSSKHEANVTFIHAFIHYSVI